MNDPEIERICGLSKQYACYLIVGVTEKCANNGTLYCSMLYFSPTQGLLGVHRKIKPTGFERVIWGEGGAESLVTFDTTIGKLGGLICWENYMPLARMSMFSKGVEIYLAPTADSRDNWLATMKHVALEGRCFVLSANQYFRHDMYPKEYQHLLKDKSGFNCRGGSVIISPLGEILAGPLNDEAGVLIADLELNQIRKAKLDFDVNGHYNRKDIFNFKVPGQPEILSEEELDNAKG